MSLSQFYEYKQSFQELGPEGLLAKPPVAPPCPNQLSEKTKMGIIGVSLEHSGFGQRRIDDQLALEGLSVYATTVSNVWLKKNLEIKYKRTSSLRRNKNFMDRSMG